MPPLKSLFLLLPLLLLLSCRERDLDLQMAPHEPKIVILANWIAGDTLAVKLLRSLDPFGKIPKDMALPQPQLKLLIDGKPVAAQFINLDNGLYKSDVLLEPAHTYQVVAAHAQYPEAATQPMYIPAVDASKVTVTRTKNVPGPVNPEAHDLFEIDVSELALNKPFCYVINFRVFFEDDIRASIWSGPDVAALNDVACYANDRIQLGDEYYEYYLVSADCLNRNKENLKFYIETSKYKSIGGKPGVAYAEKIELRVGIADESWLAFAQVSNTQPEGRDLLVLSPKRYKSNIINGYGIVTTLNEVVFEYAY